VGEKVPLRPLVTLCIQNVRPYLCARNGLLKGCTKIIPMDVFVWGAMDQKTYLKNLGGGFSPLSLPGSAYARPPCSLPNCTHKPQLILLER